MHFHQENLWQLLEHGGVHNGDPKQERKPVHKGRVALPKGSRRAPCRSRWRHSAMARASSAFSAPCRAAPRPPPRRLPSSYLTMRWQLRPPRRATAVADAPGAEHRAAQGRLDNGENESGCLPGFTIYAQAARGQERAEEVQVQVEKWRRHEFRQSRAVRPIPRLARRPRRPP